MSSLWSAARPDRQFGSVSDGGSGSENLDCALDARRSGESPVAGYEGAVQAFGQPDTGGVIGSDVRAQFVRADHQRTGRESNDGECSEILDCRTKSSCRQSTGEPSPAKDGPGLAIDEIRC
jgi:hypothetical protein